MTGAELKSLDHVVIGVADLERATENYASLLGRSPAWRGTHPGQGTVNAIFPLGSTYVELLSPEGAGPVGDLLRHRLEQQGEGLAALAFGTDDADWFAERVSKAGIEVGMPEDGGGRDEATGAERHWRTVMLPMEATRGVLNFAIQHVSPPLENAPLTTTKARAVGGVDHVVVMTADVDATNRVYGDLLGLRLALDREFPDRGLRLVFFRVGGVTVEIGGRIGASPEGDSPDNLWGIAYKVGDIEAAHARLVEEGFDLTGVRTGQKKGTRVCTVKDRNHGVATLLIGTESKS